MRKGDTYIDKNMLQFIVGDSMLDIVIDNKNYTYLTSVKIDDNCFIAYSDGITTFISGFHYEEDQLILEEIDDATFLEVKEVMAI